MERISEYFNKICFRIFNKLSKSQFYIRVISKNKIILYLHVGGSNDPPKLSTQASQMQSAVQLLTQEVLSRHTSLRPQSVQSWSNPSIKQHPGIYNLLTFYKICQNKCFFR